TEFFLQRIGVRKKDITELRYRGMGWPGFMRISLKDGKTVKVAEPLYWRFLGLDFFIPRYCLLCSDGLNELADLSFGDAWLPEFSTENLGTSIVIVRSSVGKNLIHDAKRLHKTELIKVPCKKVIQSQLSTIYFKKINIRARARVFGLYAPCELIKPKVPDYFFAVFTYLNSQVFSRSSIVKFVLKKVPVEIISVYYFLPKLLYSKALDNFKKRLFVHG
ncbi:MAG: Coenzyme F420 hydrogenase/dehydrogenase, beta subunit C-terminal domain, partial [Thermodesulfovibrionales bacterium]